MNIRKMIELLGGHRVTIAKNAGISLQQLNNMVSRGAEVQELKDGRFIVTRSDATYFERV